MTYPRYFIVSYSYDYIWFFYCVIFISSIHIGATLLTSSKMQTMTVKWW